MATRHEVKIMMERLSSAFSSFRASDGLADILCEHLSRFSDSVVKDATRRLIDSAESSPSVAAIVQACKAIQGYDGSQEPQTRYVDYWDRPQRERDEIDAARDECMRVMGELESGIPAAQVMRAHRDRTEGRNNGQAPTPKTRPPKRDDPFSLPGWMSDW